MDRYVKVKLSLKDKLNLLWFDLLPESLLIQQNVVYKSIDKDKSVSKDDRVVVNDLNNINEDIPFFDNTDDGESNF